MLRFTANLSLLFNETGLSKRFQAAAVQGFKAVEIQFPYSMPVSQIQHELTKHAQRIILFNVAADDLLQGGEGLASVPEKQTEFRDAVAQALVYAQALKPVAINILPGCCFNPDRQREYLLTFKENLLYAVDAFSSLGIKTVFEAVNTLDMPGFLIHSGLQMLEIIDQLNHPHLAMQFDIYHMTRMGENPAKFITEHAEKIGHIQFADNPGRGQPGSGNINFRHLFAAIEQSGYSGWLGAEYQPTGKSSDSLAWLKKY